MAYAAQADLVARFGSSEVQQISDINNTGAIDAGRVTQFLNDASAFIDGYLASRYTLPLDNAFASAAPMLNLLCCDIARYRLMTRPTEEAKDRFDTAVAWLEKVAKGAIALGAPTADEQAKADGPTIVSNERVFDRCRLEDWVHPRGLP
jgi:phage gp36-like protein